MSDSQQIRIVVLVSANAEWKAVRRRFADAVYHTSPLGEWCQLDLAVNERTEPVVFFHGGWGKIAAAASAQYVIDHWSPLLLVNLGTCGGFEGDVEPGTILLVEKTIVYDILEQMSDSTGAIAHYTTKIDLAWLVDPLPMPARRTLLVSGDRDLVVEEIPRLRADYNAVAGDWESGAIAYVAARNHVACLILRGVSDVVGSGGDEFYGAYDRFVERSQGIMNQLIDNLPAWVVKAEPVLNTE